MDVSGETLRLREVEPFTLRENFYQSGLVLSKHANERAYITFVIEGIFSERYATRTVVCRTGMVRYLPAGETHENVIQARSRCLSSAKASAFEQLRQSPDVPRKPVEINGRTPPGWQTGSTPNSRVRIRHRPWRSKDWCSKFWPRLRRRGNGRCVAAEPLAEARH